MHKLVRKGKNPSSVACLQQGIYKSRFIETLYKTRLGRVLNQSSLRLTYVGSDDPIDLKVYKLRALGSKFYII